MRVSHRRISRFFTLPLVFLITASTPFIAGCSDSTGSCCVRCRDGKPCGNICIARDKQCIVGKGCAYAG